MHLPKLIHIFAGHHNPCKIKAMSFEAYLTNIKAKTGKSPEDFQNLASAKGLLRANVKAGEIVAWLKDDFELGHGHAMAIYKWLCDTGALPGKKK